MKIYFFNRPVLDATDEDIKFLLKNNYIHRRKDQLELNRDCKEIKYLFNENIKLFKKLIYLEHINKMHFTCEHCGKPYSFHVSPKIDEDGKVNFKEIICVCKECRTKKLKEKDILVPQFKKKINWKKEIENIRYEIKQKGIKNVDMYFKKRKLQIKLIKFTKLVLPPLEYTKETILTEEQELLLKKLTKMGEINLKKYENRKKVRRFLYLECRGFCPVCGKKIEEDKMTIDHIVAKYLEGKNVVDNFIGMCEECNTYKDNMSVLEFLCSIELDSMPLRILKEAYNQQGIMEEYLKDLQIEIENII